MAIKKINYSGNSKVIKRLCEVVNGLIDGGGSGSTVSYQQTLQSGTETGEITIDGVATKMYAPTQPTNVSDLTNDAGYLTSSDVSAVAMSGSYSDLSNTPTLGTAAAENVGVANGVAELDANGKVPSSQLPSYVDDVIEGYYDSVTDRFYEESTFTTVIPPESGKSWVDIPSNKSYRWTGSVYTRVDEGVQLGETSSTAYRGDRGKTAYDHSQSDHSTITPAFTEASTRANIATGESIATIFGKIKKYFTDLKAVAFSGSYSDLSNTPTIPDELADLADDSTHRVVTDTEKSTWNNKSDFSGSYNDLTDKPTIPDAQIQSDWNQTDNTKKDFIKNKPSIPTKVSDLQNDSGFITGVDVEDIGDVNLTNLANGQVLKYNSTSQKWENSDESGGGATYTEGDGIDISAQNEISVDTTFSEASTRTNIASGEYFDVILGKISKFFSDLKAVAFSGSYNDLTNKPTIPAAQVNADWNASSGVAQILNKPTIPTVNNATLTIQKNGTTVKTFTANASSNVTCNITVPTAPSGVGINNVLYSDTDIPEGAANLSATATAHKITAYRNGLSIPYKANDTNDGGILRVRGTTESDCILELATWDDSGAGETIQFNYYPTTSQVTPTYSVSVPKKSGTIALTSDIPTNNNQLTNGAGYITSSGSCASATKATKDGNGNTISSTYLKKSGGNMSGNLGIGSSAAGGYLNGSASNGGCNSILIGDDVWLGDVNDGGILGMKSTGNTCGFRFLNSSGNAIGTLASASGTLQFNGNNILHSNNCTSYSAKNVVDEDFAVYNGSRRFKQTSSSGNYSYNDSGFGVKNAADSGFATIYASNVGSSLKFKENVKNMTDEEAEKLLKIRVVTYDYKRGIGIADGADAYNQRGVIAEEVNSIIPYVVIKRELGSDGNVLEPYGVEYHKFIPYLIKMIQIQQDEIDELKAQIKEIMEVIK